MKVRALGSQVTVYDDEGNIIKEIPERYPLPPDHEVRTINIVDFEDRLMGLDPDRKPDYFTDLDQLEKFDELSGDDLKRLRFKGRVIMILGVVMIILSVACLFLGYYMNTNNMG